MLFIAGGLFLALVAADLLDLTSAKKNGRAGSLGLSATDRAKLG